HREIFALDGAELEVPHSRAGERGFGLVNLAEVAIARTLDRARRLPQGTVTVTHRVSSFVVRKAKPSGVQPRGSLPVKIPRQAQHLAESRRGVGFQPEDCAARGRKPRMPCIALGL